MELWAFLSIRPYRPLEVSFHNNFREPLKCNPKDPLDPKRKTRPPKRHAKECVKLLVDAMLKASNEDLASEAAPRPLSSYGLL